MAEFLDWWEKTKMDKHGKHCHDQRNNFLCLFFLPWHAREGGPVRTRYFESTHGSENGWTHFTCAVLVKQSNHNHSRKILLTNDPWSSTPQSPAGQGSGMGPGIGPWFGTLNCATEWFCAQRHKRFYTTHVTRPPPPPHLRTARHMVADRR